MLKRLLVIDFNPVALQEVKARGVAALFGDIASIEVLKHAHINHARFILSTIPDLLLKGVDNVTLVRMCKAIAPRANVIATADDAMHEQRLRAEGAAATVRIYEITADALVEAVTESTRARRRTDARTPAQIHQIQVA
jgi:voltage-gated potassium channel Kch